MLTKELLKSNVASLTDDQITAIELLSKNDEDKVVGDLYKTVHDRFDAKVKELTGVDKTPNMKSLDYMATAIDTKMKASVTAERATELQGQITSLTSERDTLQQQLKAGSNDEVLKGQIATLEQRVKDKESELVTVRSTYGKEKEELEGKLKSQQAKAVDLELNHAYDKHIVDNKVKFKAGIPDTILQETLRNRKAALTSSLTTDWIDDGSGGQRLVLRDDKGEIMRNPDNKLEPFTPGELFIQKITDLVDPGQKQQGGGTTPPGTGSGAITPLDLTSARSQVKADEVIVNHILKVEGIAKTDPKFAERQKEIRAEHKVEDLPIREGATTE